MARPLRLEYPGAVYHLTSRGDRREPIYRDDGDRETFLHILGLGLARFHASALAYCLMGNHDHLMVQTHRGGLSQLMRHVNRVYTQAFNRRHGLVGHLFQGRYKAIVCDSDRYLMALCRYVERNPVAAGLVSLPADRVWSSFRARTGAAAVPDWLDTAQLQAFMLQRTPRDGPERAQAQRLYAQAAGAVAPAPDAEREVSTEPGASRVGHAGDAADADARPSSGRPVCVSRCTRVMRTSWRVCRRWPKGRVPALTAPRCRAPSGPVPWRRPIGCSAVPPAKRLCCARPALHPPQASRHSAHP